MDIQTYKAGIDLARAEAPDHPLLSKAERDFNPVNCMYLQKILDSISVPGDIEKIGDTAVPQKDKVSDPVVNKLYKQKNKLMVERAKLSNSYHDVVDQESRRSISLKLDKKQEEVAAVTRKIDFYYEYGKLPEEHYSDLPSDQLELYKLRNNTRSMISRAKNKLRMLAEKPAENAAKIKDREDALKRYELKLERIEKYIEDTSA